MTTRHVAILCAVVLGTFSLIYFLPQQLGYQPMGIVMKLPEYIGAWWGKDATVSAQEREVLGADTEFARKTYVNGSNDVVYVSIVLSGQDMMTGIHRPERCLLAQGWSTGSSSLEAIEIPGFGRMKATRLHTFRKDTRPVTNTDPAQGGLIQSLSYYWFVGATDLAATHEQRIAVDFKDRIFRGYNQRWAMVTLTSEITAGRQRFGRDEKQTDDQMHEFIQQLAPTILGESLRRNAAVPQPGQRWTAQLGR